MLDDETGSSDRYIYRFAHCELSEATGELRVRGAVVPLPPRDRAVLFLLVRRAGDFVSNEEAATAIWGDYPAKGKTVGNAIWNVRQAIGDDDHAIIKNERNRGYILVAPIEKTLASATPELQLVAGLAVPGRPDCMLHEKIGSGGYGDVWLCKAAEGLSVFKFSRESAHVAAIKREVTISRLLQASLSEEQQQYFVPIVEWDFEVWPSYVETPYAGSNLKAWATKRGGLKTVALTERLEIMATIADAVALAHSVGALHKDLKPENILIQEPDGARASSSMPGVAMNIRLTDFGAGHLLNIEKVEQLDITVRGWTMSRAVDSTSGTLLWMAPELFEGAPPTLQSDVYSLGVMLYQMTVGDLGRVLAPDWHPDIDDELLREDIDLATRRNPAQRLGDAKELARRLRSLPQRRTENERLHHERRRAEAAEEQLKRTRARRPFVWMTSAALAIGLATSSYFYYQQVQKTRAAQALSDFVADDFLNAALPANGGTATISLKDAMAKAVPLAAKRFAQQPELEAKILGVFGDTTSDLGAFHENQVITQRLAELDAQIHGPGAAMVLIDRLIVAYDLLEEGKTDEANKALSDIRPLVKAKGADSIAYPTWLQTESSFAFEQADFNHAIELSKEMVAYYRANKGSTKFDPSQLDLAYSSLMQSLVYSGRAAEALKLGREVLPDIVSRNGSEDSFALTIRQYLAGSLRDLRQFDQADKEFSSVCPEIEKQNGVNNKDALDCRMMQAQLLASMRQWPKAETQSRRIYTSYGGGTESCQKLAPCLYAMSYLAYSLEHTGHGEEALNLARQAVQQARASGTRDPTVMPFALYVFASVAAETKQIAIASQSSDQLATCIKNLPQPGAEWSGRQLLVQARILLAGNKPDEARQDLERARAIFDAVPTLTIIESDDVNDLLKRLNPQGRAEEFGQATAS